MMIVIHRFPAMLGTYYDLVAFQLASDLMQHSRLMVHCCVQGSDRSGCAWPTSKHAFHL